MQIRGLKNVQRDEWLTGGVQELERCVKRFEHGSVGKAQPCQESDEQLIQLELMTNEAKKEDGGILSSASLQKSSSSEVTAITDGHIYS